MFSLIPGGRWLLEAQLRPGDDAGAPLVVAKEAADGLFQTEIVQQGRPQPCRNLMEAIEETAGAVEAAGNQRVLARGIAGLGRSLQVERNAGHHLAQLVVQIARQAAAFVLLGCQQPRGQSPQLRCRLGQVPFVVAAQGGGAGQIPGQDEDKHEHDAGQHQQPPQELQRPTVEYVRRDVSDDNHAGAGIRPRRQAGSRRQRAEGEQTVAGSELTACLGGEAGPLVGK